VERSVASPFTERVLIEQRGGVCLLTVERLEPAH
jgi:hypothetical protein